MTDLLSALARELAAEPTTRELCLADGSTFQHAVGPVSYTTQAHYNRKADH